MEATKINFLTFGELITNSKHAKWIRRKKPGCFRNAHM